MYFAKILSSSYSPLTVLEQTKDAKKRLIDSGAVAENSPLIGELYKIYLVVIILIELNRYGILV